MMKIIIKDVKPSKTAGGYMVRIPAQYIANGLVDPDKTYIVTMEAQD